MKHEYRIEKEITSVEVDYNLECKLSYIFQMLQEVSYYQSEEMGFGKKDTIDKNLHWVITRFDVEIIRMPKYGDTITVVTYPGEYNALFYYRHYYIKDNKHNIILKAVSLWAVIDNATHMIKKDAFNGLKIPVVHKEGELPLPGKINDRSASTLTHKSTIKYSDIDLNNHLNNTRYIELIQDALPLEFFKENTLTFISINYLAELKVNDEVSVYTSNSNPITILGKKEDKEHFVASLSYKKR